MRCHQPSVKQMFAWQLLQISAPPFHSNIQTHTSSNISISLLERLESLRIAFITWTSVHM